MTSWKGERQGRLKPLTLSKMYYSDALIGYQGRKAAQVAAYFLLASGGTIDKLKLSKLLYLAERESMAERGRPMFYDEHYSLKDGPICSNALNGVNGIGYKANKQAWAEFVVKADNRSIKAVAGLDESKLDELSKSDIDVLKAVWTTFGHMAPLVLRKWTHEHLPEYVEVPEGRLPISYKDIYEALGYQNAQEMAEHVAEYRSLEAAIAS